MKLQLLKRNEIESKLWDECVATASYPLVYAYSWFLDLTSKDWWGVVSLEEGKYTWVMPFPIDQNKGYYFIQMPLFTPELGYFTSLNNTESYVTHAIDLIRKKVKYCIEYHGNSEGYYPGFQNAKDLIIDLNTSHQHINSLFSKVKRKNVRQAYKRNTPPIKDDNINGFLNLMKEYTLPKIGITSTSSILNILEPLLFQLFKREYLRIYSIYNVKGELEASSLFIFHQSRWQYFLNSGKEETKNKFGRLYIFDLFLEEEQQQKRLLHLGTYTDSENADDKYKNVVRSYFEQLTKKEINIPYISWNDLPWYINLPHQLKKWLFHKIKP